MEPSVTDEQQLRFASALERLAGDQELLVEMAWMVADDAPALLQELDEELQSQRLDDVAATLHKLKGMFSTFETGAPVNEMPEWIRVAREGNVQQTVRLKERIEPQLQQLYHEIRHLAVSSQSSA